MRPPYDDREGDLTAALLLGAAALVVGTATVVWLAAELTLLLSGHGWTRASLPRSGAFLLGLVRGEGTAASWRHAYADAPDLAPIWLFWTFAWMIAALAAVLGGAAVALVNGHRFTSKGSPARWAAGRHERKLAAPAAPDRRKWRLVAGRSRTSRRILAGHDCVSAVVFGPNGSGKTTSLIVPNVLDWDGPVVMTTAKPQDLEPVCSARRDAGPVWVIAPGGAPGHRTHGWDPVSAATTPENADRVAEWLVDASGMTQDPRAKPWNAQARKYLKGLLLAAYFDGKGIGRWCEWLYSGERARDQIEDLLRSRGYQATAIEYASTFEIHEEGKGSVLFTAMGLADTYSRPGVADAADAATFRVDDLFEHHGTLVIVTPSGEGERFAPYFTALVSAVVHAAETRAAAAGGPITPRVLLALDEAGNVFRYPRLPHLLTTSRGNGIQLLLVYHDLAQVEHLYGGREVARTVLSNAKMRLLLPGVGDLETLRYWSDLLGRTRTTTRGETYDSGRRTRSRNENVDDLAPLHVLQQLPAGQAVLVYENLPPSRIRLMPWFKNRRYRHLRVTT